MTERALDQQISRIIRGYELREAIGEGGFGLVYRAYQEIVEREVAIKVILPERANQPNFIRNFEVEAQLIARLEHLHIIPLYDFWREPSGAYLVMRWLRGGSVHDALLDGPWEVQRIARLLDQIGAALTVAHRNGVVHRDLKPGNILLDEDGNAYLADFGIAKSLGADNDSAEDVLIGSPVYISPEQVLKEPVVPQTDIYSLGIVLFQLLTGELPFDAATYTTVMRQHVNAPLPSLQAVRPDLPAALDPVLQRATAKYAEARFPDALSLAAEFRQALSLSEGPVLISDEVNLTVPRPDAPKQSDTLVIGEAVQPRNPYKGLRAFEESDANDFFGRADLIKQLITQFGTANDAGGHFLAVLGPSGSGKSSAVKAGLIPALRQGALPGSANWFIAEMTPGAEPFKELEAALLRVAATAPPDMLDQLQTDSGGLQRILKQILPDDDTEFMLVIDQFEEIFTLVESEKQRAHLLDSLFNTVTHSDNRLHVIITLRADFYDRPLMYPSFGTLVRENTEVILPLMADELEQAITNPADSAGLILEDALVTAIVNDVLEQPGALPLLQYALTELFERRDGRTLTLAAYQESGGVSGALARRADDLYADLDPRAQDAAQQLFLRLVTLGENAEDTRRRALQAELLSLSGASKDTMQAVIDIYGKYRLLAFDHEPETRLPTAEVAHEALIRQWQRLRDWLDANRDDLRLQRHLATATAEWVRAGRDSSFLATGSRLAQFEGLLAGQHVALNTDEATYLDASFALRKRAAQRLRLFVAGLIVFAIFALALAIFAFDRQNRAQEAEAVALTERDRADLEARVSRSRELAVTALTNVDEQVDLALLLSLEALQQADTFEARNSLLTALLTQPHLQTFLRGQSSPVRAIAVSPNGDILATGGRDGAITLRELETGTIRQPILAGHDDFVNALAFSPDGATLISGSSDATLRLWDVATGEPIGQTLEEHQGEVWSAAFSPNGNLIATGDEDGQILLWDAQNQETIGEFSQAHEAWVFSLAFSDDGALLASASDDGTAKLWNVETREPIGEPLVGHTNSVLDVAFSPDGQMLATGSADNTARLWDVETVQPIGQPLRGHSDWVRSVAFGDEGNVLATGSADNSLRLWDTSTGRQIGDPLNGHTEGVWGITFLPDGQNMFSSGLDTTIALWSLVPNVGLSEILGNQNETVSSIAIDSTGTRLATANGLPGGSGTIFIWELTQRQAQSTLTGHNEPVTSLAFNPNGSILASGSADFTLRLWNVEDGIPIGDPLTGHSDVITTVAFSPDGKTLATGSQDNTVRLWDAGTGEALDQVLIGHTDWISNVAFSPDGSTIATGSFDDTIRLWNPATGEQIGDPFSGHRAEVTTLAFSPDGETLASGSRDNTIMFWNPATGDPIGQPLEGHSEMILDIAYSPDGQILASSSGDESIILWDIATSRALGLPLIRHTDRVWSLAFHPDGQTLLSGGGDAVIIGWDVTLEAWHRRACQLANRNLSTNELARFLLTIQSSTTCDNQ